MPTFCRILFPTDFSPESRQALQYALRMTGTEEGEVIVQHVVDSYFEKHSHWTTLFDIHEMQKYMDMYVDTEMTKIVPKESGNKLSFRNVISEGRTAPQIVELAEKDKADLIVMGPATGAVTGEVIRATSHPVLSVPAKTNADVAHRLQRLVVATDFSEDSKKVVEYALDLKKRMGCEAYLLYVVELSNAIRFGIRQGHFRDASEKIKTWADNQLENLTPDEFIQDKTVHRIVEEGHAADTISRIADSKDAGLVVMGAHGHGAVGKFFVGSTAEKVLSRLRQPVLTLRI